LPAVKCSEGLMEFGRVRVRKSREKEEKASCSNLVREVHEVK